MGIRIKNCGISESQSSTFTVIRSPLSSSLNAAYFGEIIVPRRLFDLKPVAYPYGEPRAVFKYAAAVFKIGNIIGVYGKALVYGNKPRVSVGLLNKLRHGHAAAKLRAVRKCDIQIVRVGYDRNDIFKRHADSPSFTINLDIIMLWQQSKRVPQNVPNALRRKRLDDVLERVAGERFRHTLSAGGQEDQQTSTVVFAELFRRRNTVHSVHENIHKNNVVSAFIERAEKALPVRKRVYFRLRAVFSKKSTADIIYLVRI